MLELRANQCLYVTPFICLGDNSKLGRGKPSVIVALRAVSEIC